MNILSTLRKIMGKGDSEWRLRTQHADAYFNAWAKRYNVAESLNYYTGKQWRGLGAYPNYDPYVVNLVYSTIKVKRPSLLFDKPVYHLLPKPSPDFAAFNFDASAKRAALKQDALNQWVGDRRNYFAEEVKQAIVDAFFGFGIVETGYSANWIDNPTAQKPAYDNVQDPDKVTHKPERVIESERTFVKRIPFPQFRVGGLDNATLEKNNWFGYWEFVDRRDLENAEGYDFKCAYSGSRSTEMDSLQLPFGAIGNMAHLQDYLKKGDLVKIWKIWDTRDKIYKVWAEDQDQIIFADEYEEHPFSKLVYDDNLYGFYPIPPVSQWLSSQDEVNECSEQLRVHRRRANRKYIVSEQVDDLELQKMLNGPDGTYMKYEGPVDTAIYPVPQAPMDQANQQAFIQSKDNFNVVSQTSSEMRGQVDRQTATAAAISSKQAQITDSEPKTIVANFLVDIGENVLDKLSISVIPFWIKRAMAAQEMGTSVKQPPQYDRISGQDIAGGDHEITVMISSLSPIDNDVELQNFNNFMTMLNSNPEYALSPVIIREIASRCNYTNEEVIEEFQKMATLKLMGLQAGQGQNGGDPTQQGAQGAAQAQNNAETNQGPPVSGAIDNQMEQQVGMGG